MPIDRIFQAGFMGGSTVDSSRWFGERAKGAKSIIMPFTGAARHLSACAEDGMQLEAWDTQLFPTAVIEGIFKASTLESALDDQPRFLKGRVYADRWLRDMDAACAGFIDWVGKNGTYLDKACLYSAVTKNTYRGRMTEWTGTIQTLWESFAKLRVAAGPYINMPGEWIVHEQNFYKDKPIWSARKYDILLIDPPKIIGTSDVYSALYGPLNRAIGGQIEMDKWSWRDYTGRMRQVLEVKSDFIYFQYTTDVRPDWSTVKKLLSEYGTLEEEEVWPHRRRFDYTAIIRRDT